MPENPVSLLVGSLVLCFGLSLGGKYVFSGNVLVVFLGLWLFSAGYRICQADCFEDFRPESISHTLVLDELILASGLLISSYGFVLGADAITDLGILNTSLAGISMVSGYMISHRIIHEVAV